MYSLQLAIGLVHICMHTLQSCGFTCTSKTQHWKRHTTSYNLTKFFEDIGGVLVALIKPLECFSVQTCSGGGGGGGVVICF